MRRLIMPLVLAITLASVTSDTPLPPVPQPEQLPVAFIGATCAETKAPLSAITWNVAMTPGMNPMYAERRAPIARVLQQLEYDVLCVQEAWLDNDKRLLTLASGLPPANVFVHDTTGLNEDEEDTCKNVPLDSLLECVSAQCVDVVKEETTICAIERCRGELRKVLVHDRRCLNCLASQVGEGVETIGHACVHGTASRIYSGRNGVMLLSRWPLTDREVAFLPSSYANRPVLLAQVRVPGMRTAVEVACTHVSSPQPIPPFHRGFVTWEDEQRAQVRVATEHLLSRAEGRPVIFMGDMNFGAGNGTTVVDYSRDALDDLYAEGWSDPAAGAVPPFCSVCGGNTVRGISGGPGFLLDHIFYVSGFRLGGRNDRRESSGVTLQPLCVDRLLDRKVSVIDHAGRDRSTNLSDHYAVRVKFGFQ